MLKVVILCVVIHVVSPFTTPRTSEDCDVNADVIFVMDSSGSISQTEFHMMEEFAKDVVTSLGTAGNARFGLLSYASTAMAHFYLNTYTTAAQVVAAIDNLEVNTGGTNTAEGITLMTSMFSASHGDRQHNTNIGIVLTDGRSNSESATIAAADQARSNGIRMIAIGVGTGVGTNELNGIASYPDESNVFQVTDFYALVDVLGGLCVSIEELVSNSTACDDVDCGHGTCQDGGDSYTCECEALYTGSHCEEIRDSFDCGTHNPCNVTEMRNGTQYTGEIIENQFYYTYSGDDTKFVQCDDHGGCFIMPCGAETVWSQADYTCIHAPVPQSGLLCTGSGCSYDCGVNSNPCASAPAGGPYRHTDPAMYIQCGAGGICNIMACAPGLVWNGNLCDWPTGRK